MTAFGERLPSRKGFFPERSFCLASVLSLLLFVVFYRNGRDDAGKPDIPPDLVRWGVLQKMEEDNAF